MEGRLGRMINKVVGVGSEASRKGVQPTVEKHPQTPTGNAVPREMTPGRPVLTRQAIEAGQTQADAQRTVFGVRSPRVRGI